MSLLLEALERDPTPPRPQPNDGALPPEAVAPTGDFSHTTAHGQTATALHDRAAAETLHAVHDANQPTQKRRIGSGALVVLSLAVFIGIGGYFALELLPLLTLGQQTPLAQPSTNVPAQQTLSTETTEAAAGIARNTEAATDAGSPSVVAAAPTLPPRGDVVPPGVAPTTPTNAEADTVDQTQALPPLSEQPASEQPKRPLPSASTPTAASHPETAPRREQSPQPTAPNPDETTTTPLLPADARIEIVRSRPAAGERRLTAAYAALDEHRWADAERSLRELSRTDPDNPAILLGLAVAAAGQNRLDEARAWYHALLRVQPDHPAALAALVELEPASDLVGLESRIRTVLANHPDDAALHRALGLILAQQQRWAEAQVQFFEAYRLTPDDPVTLYNLAVSLDQLGERKTALQYYEQALASHSSSMLPIDRAALSRRIQALRLNLVESQ
ncbi:tetratricopeptide repeat protein [Hydrogenophilus thiooxidans]|uniref:tetratricopeptide repeat protein n=1 Tax=Hydrogenophilus thiooxidans TaxID=2820326 RepID=UPI001C2317CA|nr:tetratricopeptide repeat protein [Hydrogenophilus thiooxidans]